jgi:hypothetical protein
MGWAIIGEEIISSEFPSPFQGSRKSAKTHFPARFIQGSLRSP